MIQIKNYSVMNVGELNRVSVTYENIDDRGFPEGKNNKLSFYAMDSGLIEHINAIMEYLKRELEA